MHEYIYANSRILLLTLSLARAFNELLISLSLSAVSQIIHLSIYLLIFYYF